MIRTTFIIYCGLLAAAACDRSLAPSPPVLDGPGWGVVAETLEFTVTATDPDGSNVAHRLAWGEGDTSGWSGYVESGASHLHRRGWESSGTYRVSAQAGDEWGALSEWSEGLAVGVLPPPGYPDMVTGTFDFTYSPDYIAVSPDGERLYVGFTAESLLVMHSTGSGERLATARMPELFSRYQPISMCLPDNECVYLGCRYGILVLDAHDLRAIDSLDRFNYATMACLPGATALYVCTDYDPFLFAVDPKTHDVVDSIPLASAEWADGLAIGPAGDYCYIADLRHFEVLSVRLADGEVTGRTVVPFEHAAGVVVTPDGRYVYVAAEYDPYIAVVRTADHSMACPPLRVGDDAPGGMAMMPTGEHLLVVDGSDDRVFVIRTSDQALIDTIPATVRNGRICVMPDGSGGYAIDRVRGAVFALGYTAE